MVGMDKPTMWTLDELVELVRAVLSVDYDGPPNARVRDLPDRRSIRWYSTLGLVDRSSLVRGRTVLYRERQLLQVVAIKRLQAQGHSLAEIQQELAGATDDTLRAIARIPPDLLADSAPPREPPPPDTSGVRRRFWTEPVGPPKPAVAPTGARSEPPAVLVSGVALPGGVVLVLPSGAPPPSPADLAAVREAARPLIDTLASRGLMSTEAVPAEPLGGSQ